MSLINDALKRARQAQQPPTVEILPAPEPALPTPIQAQAPRGFVAPFTFTLLALIGVALVFQGRPTPDKTTKSVPTPATVAQPTPVARPADPPPISPAAVIDHVATAPVAETTSSAPPTNETAQIATPPAPVAAQPEPFKLRAVVYNPARPSAIINNQTLFKGERIGDFRVTAITPDTVTLVGNGQTKTLTLGK